MLSHDIEWRAVTLAEYNDYITKGLFVDKPFPYETWLISVDGVPIEEVDGKTRLAILAEVLDFLGEMRDTSIAYFIQRTKGDGSSSSESTEATIESSTET